MANIAELIAIDSKNVTSSLEKATGKLSDVQGDTALNLSDVQQIDASALRALEQIAQSADERSVRVVLRGVNVNVYKVLKLVKLSRRFSFEN